MAGRKVQKRGSYQKRKGQRRERMRQRLFMVGSLVLLLFLISLLSGEEKPFFGIFGDWTVGADRVPGEGSGSACEGELVVTYLDVGQADCTVLQCGEHAMMIDGGGRSTSEEVVSAVKSLGITKFDYIVATHSHEDHIGGRGAVLDEFAAETVIFRQEENDSKIYGQFQDAVKRNGAQVIVPKPGLSLTFGDAAIRILAPDDSVFKEANNCSVALMVTFGEKKFLFTGDAEEESEEQMLMLGLPLEADVFQAGHHGSQTSNTQAFAEAADPVYVVVSCGEGNEYGHPHSEVIARFEELDAQIYRTDTMGTVTVRTDGSSLSITTQRK